MPKRPDLPAPEPPEEPSLVDDPDADVEVVTLMPFVVSGPQFVHDTPPGEVLDLDPDDPQTQRNVDIGHVTPAELWQSAATENQQESE